jgi:hypothetical protein
MGSVDEQAGRGTTKGGRGRTVPMVPEVAQALARLLNRERFTGDDDPLFPGEAGGWLDGSALRRRYQAAQKRAGLRPLRFHDLRHTFGSLAVRGRRASGSYRNGSAMRTRKRPPATPTTRAGAAKRDGSRPRSPSPILQAACKRTAPKRTPEGSTRTHPTRRASLLPCAFQWNRPERRDPFSDFPSQGSRVRAPSSAFFLAAGSARGTAVIILPSHGSMPSA